jgi:hypothetical protein
MPDLATVANVLPAMMVDTDQQRTRWACHNAMLAWLYEAEFSRKLTSIEFATYFPDPTSVMTRIVTHGTELRTPITQTPAVLPGSVLVFRSDDQVARHSCAMRSASEIIGYNQVGWFTLQGADHGLSIHNPNEIRWQGGGTVIGPAGRQYKLVAVPETMARAVVRDIVTSTFPRSPPVQTQRMS